MADDYKDAYGAFLAALDDWFQPETCNATTRAARDEIYFAAMSLADAAAHAVKDRRQNCIHGILLVHDCPACRRHAEEARAVACRLAREKP